MNAVTEASVYPPVDSSCSTDGQRIGSMLVELLAPSLSTAGLLLQDLYRVCEAARLANWDGYGGRPVTESVAIHAKALLLALPRCLPPPSIVPEPDRELALEWQVSATNTFSVSISRDGTMSYAGLFGNSRVFGTEAPGHRIPDSILAGIRRVYADDWDHR